MSVLSIVSPITTILPIPTFLSLGIEGLSLCNPVAKLPFLMTSFSLSGLRLAFSEEFGFWTRIQSFVFDKLVESRSCQLEFAIAPTLPHYFRSPILLFSLLLDYLTNIFVSIPYHVSVLSSYATEDPNYGVRNSTGLTMRDFTTLDQRTLHSDTITCPKRPPCDRNKCSLIMLKCSQNRFP